MRRQLTDESSALELEASERLMTNVISSKEMCKYDTLRCIFCFKKHKLRKTSTLLTQFQYDFK